MLSLARSIAAVGSFDPMNRKFMRHGLNGLLVLFSSLTVAASPDPYAETIESAHLLGELALKDQVFHVQGLEIDATRIWATSVDQANCRGYLHEFDRASGRMLRRIEVTDGPRCHPGGISLSGKSLWVPVAEMRAGSSAVLREIDRDTLKVRRTIRVADHIGCLAANGHTLVGGNWDSRQLYIFDLDGKVPTRIVANPSATHFQDIKFRNGQLVAGGSRTWLSGTVDWIDWPTLKVTRSIRAGAIGPVRPFGRGGPFTGEGMTIEGRDLYVLPEDGPSRVFHFRLDHPA